MTDAAPSPIMTDAAPSPTSGSVPRKSPGVRATSAAKTVRTSAAKAVDATTETARDIARKTAESIEANPVAVLASGVALGVLAGAFLPRSAREATLLAPVGKRLADTARGAVDAARDTAKSELDILGLTRNAARDQVGKLIGDVVKALEVAGTAALTAAKASPPSPTPAPAPKKSAAKKAKPKE